MEDLRLRLLCKIPMEKQDEIWLRIQSEFPWVVDEMRGQNIYPIILKPNGELQWEEDTLIIALATQSKVGCFFTQGVLNFNKAARVLSFDQQKELARRLGYSLTKYKELLDL